jgi:hypothetical protein
MKSRLSKVRSLLLVAAAAVPVFQVVGCQPASLLEATQFEVANLFSSMAFDYTQTFMENLLDL